MRRDHVQLHSPAIGWALDVIAYGHHGRPLLVFPSDRGNAWDFENNGLLGGISWLVDEGRVKPYAVGSFDTHSWRNEGLSLEERAWQHARYEDWIINQVVPFIHNDCQGQHDIFVTGCSFGAFHAANFALRRADLFPVAICMSGAYDAAAFGGSWHRGDQAYFNNPVDYVAHMGGDHLDWLRSRVRLLLLAGQGQWEETTLHSTRQFAGVLAEKGIPHELDLWGYDVPHDWPSWQRMLAHHLPRVV